MTNQLILHQLFADDTSLFSIIHDAKKTAYELNKDLQRITEWAHQWRMSLIQT